MATQRKFPAHCHTCGARGTFDNMSDRGDWALFHKSPGEQHDITLELSYEVEDQTPAR